MLREIFREISSNKTRTTTVSFDFGNNQIANLRSGPTKNRLSASRFFTGDIAFLLRINMQSTRRVSETTSAFESNVHRHIVHRSLFLFPFQTPVFSCSPPPLNSPYMIHEAHSSAIRWHDTHPTTVPWNHAPWSRDPRPRYMPSLLLVWITLSAILLSVIVLTTVPLLCNLKFST